MALARGGGYARRILASLESTASDLGEQSAFADTLASAARGLSLHADHLDPAQGAAERTEEEQVALADMLTWAAGLYTMACERVIHAAFLPPEMAAQVPSVVAAVTFEDDDDDGLF